MKGGIFIARGIDKEKYIQNIMKKLNVDYQEALSVYESDIAIDHKQPQDFDLPPEKQKIAQKFAYTGTRIVTPLSERKGPIVLERKPRKENAAKVAMIAELAEFLEKHSQFAVQNITIPNKDNKISFTIGDNSFSITLTQHRTKSK